MRKPPSTRRTRVLPLVAAAALAVCGSAAAHIVPEPQVVRSGSTATVSLAVPNERPERMTGFDVTLPPGFRIVEARPTAGWTARADESTAKWSGGRLAHLGIETYVVRVEVTADPGTATLDMRQVYPSGAHVRWLADVSVRPGRPSAGDHAQSGGALAVSGAVGAAVVLGVAALAWRRRREPEP